jgi:hypothetical protein
MDYGTRHVKRSTTPPRGGPCRASSYRRETSVPEMARAGRRLPEMTGPLWKIVLTAATPAAAVGPFCWYFTRSPVASVGAMLILAVITLGAACLTAREETTRVKVREQGATDRERIRYQGENLLAEAQRSLVTAATTGPNSSSQDALALRMDARKVLGMWTPTSVADAMCITRLQEIDDRYRLQPRQASPPQKDVQAR